MNNRDEDEVELIESTSVIIDLDAGHEEDRSHEEVQYPSWLIFKIDQDGNEIIVDQS